MSSGVFYNFLPENMHLQRILFQESNGVVKNVVIVHGNATEYETKRVFVCLYTCGSKAQSWYDVFFTFYVEVKKA